MQNINHWREGVPLIAGKRCHPQALAWSFPLQRITPASLLGVATQEAFEAFHSIA